LENGSLGYRMVKIFNRTAEESAFTKRQQKPV